MSNLSHDFFYLYLPFPLNQLSMFVTRLTIIIILKVLSPKDLPACLKQEQKIFSYFFKLLSKFFTNSIAGTCACRSFCSNFLFTVKDEIASVALIEGNSTPTPILIMLYAINPALTLFFPPTKLIAKYSDKTGKEPFNWL